MTPPRGGAPSRAAAVLGVLAIGSLCAGPAFAANCSIGVISVVFGTYNTLSPASLDGAGSVSVTCDATDSYTVALSSGQGSMTARRLLSGANVMYYNLFTDAQRSMIWGDGTLGTALVSGSGTGATYTVYGRVPGGQNLPAGNYVDSITVTLDF
ncbi:MAG TPA: spore coat U domain-containing protein [Steroidobacteraceae bacterium]|nr:spore coat U domain-containing protein [Steroidobacteraceae bacterium]